MAQTRSVRLATGASHQMATSDAPADVPPGKVHGGESVQYIKLAVWELPGGYRGVRTSPPPQFMCPTPQFLLFVCLGGSDITPVVRRSHSQKLLFCTVEVNFPIYTANTHGKISQFVSATVFIN